MAEVAENYTLAMNTTCNVAIISLFLVGGLS